MAHVIGDRVVKGHDIDLQERDHCFFVRALLMALRLVQRHRRPETVIYQTGCAKFIPGDHELPVQIEERIDAPLRCAYDEG